MLCGSLELAEVNECRAHRRASDEYLLRIPGFLGDLDQLLNDIARRVELAAHDIEPVESMENGKQGRRVADLRAEIASPRISLLHLSRCVPESIGEWHSKRDLKLQLQARAVDAVRQALESFQTAAREHDCFLACKYSRRRPGCREKIGSGLLELPSRSVQNSELGCVARLRAVVLLHHLRHARAKRRSSSRAQRSVQRVLVENVRKPVPQRRCATRENPLVHKPNNRIHTLEPLEPLFDFLAVHLYRVCDHGRVELRSLHACRNEQAAISLVQPVDRSLDHTADRLGQLGLDGFDRLLEPPNVVAKSDNASMY